MLRHRLPLLVVFYLNVVLAKHKIHIGCLVPSYGSDLYGYQTAIELAAEMINNRTDILPDHEIVMVCGDTFVSIHNKVDLTLSKRFGTSYQIEIHFAVFNHLYLLFSFMKLVETL